MKKITYILILLLSVSMAIKAQQTQQAQQAVINVSGTVIDALTGETLPGVTVVIKGKVGGSITDGDGNFAVKALRGEWVIFNYIGYKPFEYLVTGDIKGLKINLTEEVQQIDEVVVTAVGVQRKISTLAAISSVDSKDLQAPAPSITNLLGGRAAGVFTLQSSGEPGKNLAEFWVRGIGTFGANSSALVLIDGLEGDINSIDPADVESFSVLKDASATAVYGVRGANGVVLITTKRGQAGKLSITGRANYTLSHLRRLPEYLRAYDYALLANEAREVRGETPLYKKIYLDVIRDGLDPDFYPDISWQDEIINPLSFKQTYYVSGRGGGDISRYFVSLGGSSESAAYKVDKSNPYSTNAGYNTYSFRINLDIDLTKTTQLKFNSDAYLSVNDRPGNVTNTDDLWRWQAELTPLVFPIRYSNGDLPSLSSGNISPYVAINYFGKTKMTQYTSKFSMAVEQDLRFITEGLKLKILGAYDRNGGYIETRTYHPALYLAIGRNNYGELVTRETVAASTQESYTFYNNTGGYDQFRRLQFETTLNYDRVFNNDHRVGGLAYLHLSDQFSSQQSNESEMNGLSANYAQIPRRYLRLTGRLAYGYKDTYMIDFNFGYTGTENFMPGRQYGFFPAIALGWVPSSYDWVAENMSWVNMFKIRGSYGTVGNDRIGGRRFPYLNRVSQGEYSVWGGAVLPVITVARVGADNLVWERALKTDIGIDAQMFGNALTFTVDFFHDKRNGIFQERVQVPGYAGLTNNPYGNVGSMVSWGSDGTASYTFNINKDVGITLRGNYTYSQNKVLNYEKLYEEYPYKDYTGLPNNIVRGYQCEGFFKDEADILYSAKQNWGTVKPGDLKYKDINGDGVINDEDIVPISYQQMFPLLVYGFGGQVSYKDLSLGVLFKGTGKVDYFRNNTGYIPFNQNNLGNILTQFKDPSTRWIPLWYAQEHGIDPSLAENPNAQLPRLQYGGNSNNSQLSDFWKGDARYLRLQEVTLNYNVRHKLLQRAGIASLDLQLVGNNLYIWDKVKDFDPEQANRVGKVYPIPATYSFQLYINM